MTQSYGWNLQRLQHSRNNNNQVHCIQVDCLSFPWIICVYWQTGPMQCMTFCKSVRTTYAYIAENKFIAPHLQTALRLHVCSLFFFCLKVFVLNLLVPGVVRQKDYAGKSQFFERTLNICASRHKLSAPAAADPLLIVLARNGPAYIATRKRRVLKVTPGGNTGGGVCGGLWLPYHKLCRGHQPNTGQWRNWGFPCQRTKKSSILVI